MPRTYTEERRTFRINGSGQPNELVTYTLEINLDELDSMARKAAASKGQKAVDGPITVKVTDRRPL